MNMNDEQFCFSVPPNAVAVLEETKISLEEVRAFLKNRSVPADKVFHDDDEVNATIYLAGMSEMRERGGPLDITIADLVGITAKWAKKDLIDYLCEKWRNLYSKQWDEDCGKVSDGATLWGVFVSCVACMQESFTNDAPSA